MKKSGRRNLTLLIAICGFASFAARADDGADPGNPPNRYVVTNLTSDLANNTAPNIDAVLQNAWGVAFSP